MRFVPTDEHEALGEAIDEIVAGCGGVDVARTWANGDTTAGRRLWSQLAELGLTGLRVSDDDGGMGGAPEDLVVAFERLGYHAAPGPYIESVAFLPHVVPSDIRAQIAQGTIATTSAAPHAPWAVDAQISELIYAVGDAWWAEATVVSEEESLSALRRLVVVEPGERTSSDSAAIASAHDEASLAAAAYLVGAGERLLDEAVSYAGVREQFGRPIGEYQSLKHQLADVRVALSFARPLVHGAAVTLSDDTGPRAVSAAKVAAGAAARRAARTALQVHGAIGYTAEHHLGLWITQVPALDTAWGTPATHRARIARALRAE